MKCIKSKREPTGPEARLPGPISPRIAPDTPRVSALDFIVLGLLCILFPLMADLVICFGWLVVTCFTFFGFHIKSI